MLTNSHIRGLFWLESLHKKSGWTIKAMKLILPARLPFSLSSVVHSHGWIRLDPFREEESTGGLAYIAQLDSGQVIELNIQEVPGGVSVSFDGNLNDGERAEIERSVTWMLGLDQDFSAFYQLARQEARLAAPPHALP